MTTNQMRHVLLSAPDAEAERVFREQADLLEDQLLGVARVPEEFVELLVELLSEPRFSTKKGAWNFVVRLASDLAKFDSAQRTRLLEAIVLGFQSYSDVRMQLTTADLIARGFPPDVAVEALARLSVRSLSEAARDAIAVGARVIFREVPRGTLESEKALLLMKK